MSADIFPGGSEGGRSPEAGGQRAAAPQPAARPSPRRADDLILEMEVLPGDSTVLDPSGADQPLSWSRAGVGLTTRAFDPRAPAAPFESLDLAGLAAMDGDLDGLDHSYGDIFPASSGTPPRSQARSQTAAASANRPLQQAWRPGAPSGPPTAEAAASPGWGHLFASAGGAGAGPGEAATADAASRDLRLQLRSSDLSGDDDDGQQRADASPAGASAPARRAADPLRALSALPSLPSHCDGSHSGASQQSRDPPAPGQGSPDRQPEASDAAGRAVAALSTADRAIAALREAGLLSPALRPGSRGRAGAPLSQHSQDGGRATPAASPAHFRFGEPIDRPRISERLGRRSPAASHAGGLPLTAPPPGHRSAAAAVPAPLATATAAAAAGSAARLALLSGRRGRGRKGSVDSAFSVPSSRSAGGARGDSPARDSSAGESQPRFRDGFVADFPLARDPATDEGSRGPAKPRGVGDGRPGGGGHLYASAPLRWESAEDSEQGSPANTAAAKESSRGGRAVSSTSRSERRGQAARGVREGEAGLPAEDAGRRSGDPSPPGGPAGVETWLRARCLRAEAAVDEERRSSKALAARLGRRLASLGEVVTTAQAEASRQSRVAELMKAEAEQARRSRDQAEAARRQAEAAAATAEQEAAAARKGRAAIEAAVRGQDGAVSSLRSSLEEAEAESRVLRTRVADLKQQLAGAQATADAAVARASQSEADIRSAATLLRDAEAASREARRSADRADAADRRRAEAEAALTSGKQEWAAERAEFEARVADLERLVRSLRHGGTEPSGSGSPSPRHSRVSAGSRQAAEARLEAVSARLREGERALEAARAEAAEERGLRIAAEEALAEAEAAAERAGAARVGGAEAAPGGAAALWGGGSSDAPGRLEGSGASTGREGGGGGGGKGGRGEGASPDWGGGAREGASLECEQRLATALSQSEGLLLRVMVRLVPAVLPVLRAAAAAARGEEVDDLGEVAAASRRRPLVLSPGEELPRATGDHDVVRTERVALGGGRAVTVLRRRMVSERLSEAEAAADAAAEAMADASARSVGRDCAVQ